MLEKAEAAIVPKANDGVMDSGLATPNKIDAERQFCLDVAPRNDEKITLTPP